MTIAFPCESCGLRYEVDSSLAGKKVRCKKCNHVFVIPVPQTASGSASKSVKSSGGATSSSPSKPKATKVKPAAPAADPYYTDDDPYGFDEEPAPRRSTPAADKDEEFIPRQTVKPVPAPSRKKKKASGESFLDRVPMSAFIASGAVLGVMAFLATAILTPAITAARHAAERARLNAEMSRQQKLVVGHVAPPIGQPDAPAANAPAANAPDLSVPAATTPPPTLPGRPRRPRFGPANLPRPATAALSPDVQVTLNVTGLVDKATADAFYQNLDALRRSLSSGNSGRRASTRNGRTVCVVWPIQDVQAFADGITFARVTGVNGRTIDVAVDPAPAAESPPAAKVSPFKRKKVIITE